MSSTFSILESMNKFTLTLLFSVALLTGCSDWTERWSLTWRINRAFPMSTEIKVRFAELDNSLISTPLRDRVLDHHKRLMQLRALNCTEKFEVRWYDSVNSIREKVSNVDCFKQQDGKILDWLNIQNLAVELNQPTWSPPIELPVAGSFQAALNTSYILTSSGNNIAIVKSSSNLITVVNLNNNTILSQFKSTQNWYTGGSLSPNGRLLAIPYGGGSFKIYRLETGTPLFDTSEYSSLIEWLPKQEAILLKDRYGEAVLIDLRTGERNKMLSRVKHLDWSIQPNASKEEYLLGSNTQSILTSIERNATGQLVTKINKEWKFALTKSSATPQIFDKGKILIYVSHPNLAWLNLNDDTQGNWPMQTMSGGQFSKLDDSTLAYIEIDYYNSSSKWRALNVPTMEVSEITNFDSKIGDRINYDSKIGYALSLGTSVSYVSKAKTINPEPFDLVLKKSMENYQAYQTRLQAELAELSLKDGAHGAAMRASEAEDAASRAAALASGDSSLIEAWQKKTRAMNVQSAIRDGLSQQAIDSIRKGRSQNDHQSSSALTIPFGQQQGSMLKNIPANAQLHAVGVYEGYSESGRVAGERKPLSVSINVRPSSSPIVLALSSYEPVIWQISNPGNRRISAILLSGYHESIVSGSNVPPTIRLGSHYAYKLDSHEYKKWILEISKYASTPLSSFQGKYTGKQFDIN